MKLHLGCGSDLKPDYINIDANNTNADRLMNVGNLKNAFKPNTIEEIYCSHMFEHLDRKESYNFLNDCHTLLEPNGVLFLAMPCIDYLMDGWNNGSIPEENFINALYGMHRDPFDYHKMGYTIDSIHKVLRKHKFEISRFLRGRPNYGPDSPGMMIWSRAIK